VGGMGEVRWRESHALPSSSRIVRATQRCGTCCLCYAGKHSKGAVRLGPGARVPRRGAILLLDGRLRL